MDVVVHVYDLPEQERTNEAMVGLGAGFFHTGVLVGDMEYSFSMIGVVRTRPLLPDFGRFRERVEIGRYTGSTTDLAEKIRELSSGDFRRGLYNVVHKNCNDFSEALCQTLLQKSIPDWINRAARMGRNVIPASAAEKMQQQQQQQQQNSFIMPGKVAEPTLKGVKTVTNDHQSAATVTKTGILSSVFGWFGYGSNDSTSNVSGSCNSSNQNGANLVQTKKSVPSHMKKELTEAQKVALAKIKSKNQPTTF
jgi:hypothetical protein